MIVPQLVLHVPSCRRQAGCDAQELCGEPQYDVRLRGAMDCDAPWFDAQLHDERSDAMRVLLMHQPGLHGARRQACSVSGPDESSWDFHRSRSCCDRIDDANFVRRPDDLWRCSRDCRLA